VELNPNFTALWEHLAEAFLVWCRRGVDGFRCDAGYKVPVPVWQYIEARVRQEFPETVFLLEGLGGSWEATENLLTEGGMQWAYSELFQNYSGRDVQWYLDYALRQSDRVGVYVHYSETHDNDRLAKRGRVWSLLRNRLCGLTSVCGGYGFTCGVEWLADEKIEVHQSRGMNWGAKENIIPELTALNDLLTNHPCFFDGAKLVRLSPAEASVYALRRDSAEGLDSVLVLVNTDLDRSQRFALGEAEFKNLGCPHIDLLGQNLAAPECADGVATIVIEPGGALCLSATSKPRGLAGDKYRAARARSAWAITALSKVLPPQKIGSFSWLDLASRVESSPRRFLGAISYLANTPQTDLLASLDQAANSYAPVVTWSSLDTRRVVPVPPGHWLLIEDSVPFRATLSVNGNRLQQHVESIEVNGKFIGCFPPQTVDGRRAGHINVERYGSDSPQVKGDLAFLSAHPSFVGSLSRKDGVENSIVLLTNGIGGMARLCVDLGNVTSKYDCVLGANLHPTLPVDRHIFVKRVRLWANIDGFIVPLNSQNLVSIDPGPPAVWNFLVRAGAQQKIPIQVSALMIEGRNTTVLRIQLGRTLPPKSREVRLTVRFDIEDRNFHTETHRTGGADYHFSSNSRPLNGRAGFEFTPAADRGVRIWTDLGYYHHEAEWSQNIPHPVEQSRGQVGAGDAFSPGWFDLPLRREGAVTLFVSADLNDPSDALIEEQFSMSSARNKRTADLAGFEEGDSFGRQLALAARDFVVRRGSGKTVIAGYPWFLDWGRDTMIAARGLLSAGRVGDVTELLINFGRFVEHGTMPNTIHGDNASNRDTSDASLWYGVVCEETAALLSENLYQLPVDNHRTITDVLREIAFGYQRGTPNGIRMDADSALIWSPSHFTWMDTNHPAGTPREGYPIEIQILWIRLLRQLQKVGASAGDAENWEALANRAEKSLHEFYWIEERGYFADLLIASAGTPAGNAIADNALRSNYLLAVAFGFVTGEKAQRCVEAAARYLVIPGALRSLAPLPVSPPLAVRASDGHLLNNPDEPYCGRYEGDEDSRRKPAYHNGTAWTWTFPIFCEALAAAWDFSPASVAAARAYLGSMEWLLEDGCIGHLPEIVDGDAPHTQRGCDAQAWGATEALRVSKLLNGRYSDLAPSSASSAAIPSV
jgi:predicted glycogen debranching enzyme